MTDTVLSVLNSYKSDKHSDAMNNDDAVILD